LTAPTYVKKRVISLSDARKTILCIDDDREVAALIAEDLSERNYSVVLAYDGKAGMEAISRQQPDLVLCDIDLPIISGFEVLERLVGGGLSLGSMPFIFLTGLSDRESELKGRRLGADDYVTKPVDFEILSNTIAARLSRVVARVEVWAKSVNLNQREVAVLTWAARGKTSDEIAMILSLTKRTVDYYVECAKTKLSAATRSHALVKAVAGGLIRP
jgi:DNA-binding response OmpR family regulator